MLLFHSCHLSFFHFTSEVVAGGETLYSSPTIGLTNRTTARPPWDRDIRKRNSFADEAMMASTSRSIVRTTYRTIPGRPLPSIR